MAGSLQAGIPVSKTSPAFLNANSTSHTWPFSAVAELIDNAYDPDVRASQLYIDVEHRLQTTCLTFTDNGNGLTPDKLHKMLSFGYCEKVEVNGHKPVGHYGNGFKSGSMRLARDALVFTISSPTMSVGFLSQSYLRNINATTVLVPMVTWNVETNEMVVEDSTQGSIQAITQHSLFRSEAELRNEFKELLLDTNQSNKNEKRRGTRIILYNLKKTNEERYELDFESNSKDILNPESLELDVTNLRPVMEHVPQYIKSLREYCSILFLKPRMKIFLRGHKVKTKLISKSLSKTETDFYKPVYLSKPLKIILGFNSSQLDYGLMMYHRNRLIKAYEHVGCQKQANDHGVGVVGVVEVDFLEPVHNKQDFNKTDRYNACINALGQKLNDYWYTKTQNGPVQNEVPQADWTWVQCDNCLKWRRLPDNCAEPNDLPDKWFCYMNRDPIHNRCEVEEEPEDEDELQMKASYNKMKKKVEPRKTGDMIRREQALAEKERELQQRQRNIQSLETLPQSGASNSNKPTFADYEKAKQELKEARRREMEQQNIIAKLTKQHKQMMNGQNQIRHNMSEGSNMSTLKSIGRTGELNGPSRTDRSAPSRTDRSAPSRTDRSAPSRTDRSAPSRTGRNCAVVGNGLSPGAQRGPVSKERIPLPGGDAVIVTRNDTSSEESETATPKSQRKRKKSKFLVKFPHKKRQREDVIVIDSDVEISDKESSSSDVDVKPDIEKLQNNVQKTKNTEHDPSSLSAPSGLSSSHTPAPTGPSSSHTPAPTGPSSSRTTSSPRVPHISATSSRSTQTDPVSDTDPPQQQPEDSKETVSLLRIQLEKSQSQLSHLRNNVGKLLQTILPDLQVDQVEYIDAIVKEMVRVNTKNSDS